MKAVQKITVGSLMVALLAVAAGPAAGDTAVFREGLSGYTGTEDNGLYGFSSLVYYNSGASTTVPIGDASADGSDRRRTILRFDVTSIPTNAILSATLRLTKIETGLQTNFTFSVYQIADANAAWIEGTGTLAGSANPGESVWNRRAYTIAAWAGSVGLGTAGTDYVATPMASGILYDVGNTGSVVDQNGVAIDIALPPSLINYWRTNTNAGLLLVSDSEAGGFAHNGEIASAEHGTAAWRPTLTVEYVPEPTAAVLGVVGLLAIGQACRRRAA